jgi:NADP-dependent 3-hydroxy acid dehydrogenase YdfG
LAAGLRNVEDIQLDVTDDESVQHACTELGKKTQTLVILINYAGVFGGYPQAELDSTISQFIATYDANV